MSDFFTTFAGSVPLWLLPLVVGGYVWGKMVRAGLNPDHPESFQRTVRWLREDNFGVLYLNGLGWLLDKVSGWIGDREKLSASVTTVKEAKGKFGRLFGLNVFTHESYEKCLLLAFMYPLFFFMISWAMGGGEQLGNLEWFKGDNNFSNKQRWLMLGGTLVGVTLSLFSLLQCKGWWRWFLLFVLFGFWVIIVKWLGSTVNIVELYVVIWRSFLILLFSIFLGGWLVGFAIYGFKTQAHWGIYSTAFYFSFSFAFVWTIALATIAPFFFVTAFAVIVGFVVAFVFTGKNVVAFVVFAVFAFNSAGSIYGYAVAGVIAGAVAVAISIFQNRSVDKGSIGWFWNLYSLLFVLVSIISIYLTKQSVAMTWILFWLLLPLVNAPLDWLSLGVTRSLLQAVRAGKHSGKTALEWALADLLLALFFLFLITAVLIGVTALGNAVAGRELVEIDTILSQLNDDPTSVDHWWIYFMLLSTLIPTLIHFALAGGAATLWLPRKFRLKLADGLDKSKDIHKIHMAWAYLTFTPVIGFILVPAGLLYSLWWLISSHGTGLGGLLLDWAQILATAGSPAATQ